MEKSLLWDPVGSRRCRGYFLLVGDVSRPRRHRTRLNYIRLVTLIHLGARRRRTSRGRGLRAGPSGDVRCDGNPVVGRRVE